MTERTCGDCHECCIHYRVPEMNKPAFTPCEHLCKAGCAIHDQPRPPICTEFLCYWMQNDKWGDELRPDRNRIIFRKCHFVPDRYGTPHRLLLGNLRESTAQYRRENRRLLDRLERSNIVVLLNYQSYDADTDSLSWAIKNTELFPHLNTLRLLKIVSERSKAESRRIKQVENSRE